MSASLSWALRAGWSTTYTADPIAASKSRAASLPPGEMAHTPTPHGTPAYRNCFPIYVNSPASISEDYRQYLYVSFPDSFNNSLQRLILFFLLFLVLPFHSSHQPPSRCSLRVLAPPESLLPPDHNGDQQTSVHSRLSGIRDS
jgi:hypothetical protein